MSIYGSLDFKRSYSKGIASQASIGEMLLKIVKETERLLKIKDLSISTVGEYLSKSLRAFTGASWAEVFFCEESGLVLKKTLQTVKSVPINENSLPGYCAKHMVPQIINNASSSSLYTNFSVKFDPFLMPSKETAQASSVACVPIEKEGSCKLVLLLFNKLDENNSLAYFTESDISLIEALGLMALNNLENYLFCANLQKKLENMREQNEEGTKLISLGIESVHRRNSLEQCLTALNSESKLSKSSVHQISQVMKCDGIIFHVFSKDSLKPVIALGMDTFDTKHLMTKTSEFCVMSSRQVLNVSDLLTEPLWEQEKFIKFKCLLACPILDKEDSPLGCIEFFRKNAQFSPVDEKCAEKIVKVLSEIKIENFVPGPSDRGAVDKSFDLLIRQLNCFNLSPHELYDYPKLFEAVRESIRKLIRIDSSTIFIADQGNSVLWTQQSQNCDALAQPILKDTLFGLAYHTQTKVVLPKEIQVSDIDSYDKFGIVQPIISNLSISPVIGIISVFRSQDAFSPEEIEILETVSGKVARLLESLWVYKYENHAIIDENTEQKGDNSPEAKFRMANSKNKSSIHYLYDENEFGRISDPKELMNQPDPLYSLGNISISKLGELKAMFAEIQTSPGKALVILVKRIRQLIPCQYAKLFIMDQHEENLVDVVTSNISKPAGLINLCLSSKEFVFIKSNANENVYFDKHIDSLGGDALIETFLAVPILVNERPLGVIALANASINFGPEDLAMAEFLTVIPKEFLSESHENIKGLNDAIQVGRKHKMLQQWCKQVFFVSNSTQSKIALVKDILNKLNEQKNFDKILKAGLEMICALVNSEQAAVVKQDNGEFVEYLFKKSKIIKRSHLEDEGLLYKALEKMRPISVEALYGKENMIVVPFAERGMPKVLVKAYNKRDETLSCYCNFNKEDEQALYDFAKSMSYSFDSHERNESPEQLKQFIKQYASSLNIQSLLSTIRTACQKLLDCDRATIFMIEGKEMVVKSQGIEKEIPGGFKIPIGKGIIGNVAQTGQTENIKDVYDDPRFDPAMDKKTGYRTSTMLCMPVIDGNGKVIAALQMINKKLGFFNESDEETLAIFSEIISSALQNCNLFMHTITEGSRILNILNSIGNYIIVFNSEGVMEYANKSLKRVFGISRKFASKCHYSSWLRENRQLVLDITAVTQNPLKKFNRSSQKIVSATFKKTRTLPNISRALQSETSESYFHYTVVGVQAFSKSEFSGVVVILEDATALFELTSKLEKIMQSEVVTKKSSVYGETALQKCIDKLTLISNSIDDSGTKSYIEEVIKTLKLGNLNIADVYKDLPKMQGVSSKAISECIGLEFAETQHKFELMKKSFSKGYVELPDSLKNIRDINLDPFEIEDHHIYVKRMFDEFELLDEMQISSDLLSNFCSEVKERYSVYNNPFHNFYHGFNVLHATYLLVSMTHAKDFFSVHEIFALFIAAFCHDLEHPGKNNSFEINRGSHLAILYNDKSVLENHHSAVTFKILQDTGTNLLGNLQSDMKKKLRKLIIVSILATDMAKHIEEITTMNTRFKDLAENPLKDTDRENVAGLLIHGADLSHPCKNFENYQKWSKRVSEEFTIQFKEEVSLGLPPTEMMRDLDRPDVYYANEFGFLKFAIKPLWDCLNLWLNPRINHFIQNLNENINNYQKLKEEHPRTH